MADEADNGGTTAEESAGLDIAALDALYAAGVTPGLVDLAAFASYSPELLKINEDTAYNCAKLIADAMEIVDAACWYAGANLQYDQPFSCLPSGEQLRKTHSDVTQDFIDVARKTREENLRALHDVFVAAGKAFQEAEDVNTMNFGDSELNIPPTLVGAGDIDPALQAVNMAEYGSAGGNLSILYGPLFTPSSEIPYGGAPTGRMEGFESKLGATVGFEDPDSYYTEDLYNLGEDIRVRGLVETLREKANMWSAVADTIQEKICVELVVQMTEAMGEWEGTAKDAAAAAVETSIADIENLPKACYAMSDLNACVAYALDATQASMPPSPEVPKTWYSWTIRDGSMFEPLKYDGGALQDARDAMEDNYRSKLEEADKNTPIMPEPTTELGGEFADALEGAETDPNTTTDDPPPVYTDVAGVGGATDLSGLGATTPAGASLADYGSTASDYADQLAAQQEEAAEAARQQAAQAAMSRAMSTGQDLLGQAAGGLEQAANAAGQSMLPSVPAGAFDPSRLTGGLSSGLASGLRSGGGGGVGSGSGASTSTPKPLADASKLFPRADISGTTSQARAGLAGQQMQGMAGTPGASGAPGAGARQGNDNKHERAKYLDRADNIDEALGDAPEMTRPVVGETAARTESEQQQQQPAAVVPPASQRPPAPVPPVPNRVPETTQRVVRQ